MYERPAPPKRQHQDTSPVYKRIPKVTDEKLRQMTRGQKLKLIEELDGMLKDLDYTDAIEEREPEKEQMRQRAKVNRASAPQAVPQPQIATLVKDVLGATG
jgi:hypothetical protein